MTDGKLSFILRLVSLVTYIHYQYNLLLCDGLTFRALDTESENGLCPAFYFMAIYYAILRYNGVLISMENLALHVIDTKVVDSTFKTLRICSSWVGIRDKGLEIV